MTRPLPALVAILVAGVLVLCAGTPGGAAPAVPGAASQRSPRLDLVSQSPLVPSEGEFTATLRWTGPVAGHQLRTRIFQVADDEADLEQRAWSGQLNQLPAVPLEQLERNAEGDLVVRMPVRSLPLPGGDAERTYLPDAGVYPIELEITGPDGEQVASLVTDLIRLPRETAEIEPVPVAVVVRVGAGGLSLREAVQLLEGSEHVPVTVLIDPIELERVAEADPELVERFGANLDDTTAVAGNGVNLDLSALAEIGQLELYETVRDDAVARVSELLGLPVTNDIVRLTELPTRAAAEHLVRAGVEVVLRPAGSPEGTVATRAGPLPVLSPDAELLQALGRPGVDAYHLLARLALRFQDGETAPVVLTADPRLGVNAADVEVVLRALEQPGILTPVELEDIAPRSASVLPPSERPRQDLRSAAPLLRATLEDLREYGDFYVDGPLPPAYLEARVIAALAVDVAPEQRTERLAAVRRDIEEAFDVITLPEGRTVNLAATTSPLPLTLTSEAAGSRLVRITFSSDKLTFPGEDGGSRLVELDAGTSALDFVVESRSLGVSPLDVVVSTPDGARELARTRITIRSTAVPGLGLLLSGAALGFLIFWWVRHRGRGRSTPVELGAPQPVA